MRVRASFVAAGAVIAIIAMFVGGMYLEHQPPEGGRDILTVDGSQGVESFQIASGTGEVLWRIDASPARAVAHVHYGEIPDGFRQLVPPAGRPRPFEKGEKLETKVTTPHDLCRHVGKALDARRFLGGFRECGPRTRPGAGA